MSQILNTALLGTEKLPFQTDNLVGSIKAYLDKNSADSPETAFLRAATLLKAYHKAGENAEKLIVPTYTLAPDETRDECPSTIVQHFKTERNTTEANLLVLALAKCAAKNWALPAAILPVLLEIGSNKETFKRFGKQILHIAGEKGQWLAQFNPAWAYLITSAETEETVWAEGKLEARLQLFKSIRENNPILSVEMLTGAWSSISAKERKAFLELMRVDFSASDETFLENAYEDIMKQKENDKGVKAELKTELVNLLIAIPNSRKQNWILEQLFPYFTKKKTLMGFGKTEITLDLPTEVDSFFYSDMMVRVLGRSKNNTFLAWRSDAENWFCELLPYLPPQRFAAFLDIAEADLIALFQNDFKGKIKTKHPFAAASFGSAIVTHQLHSLAFAYLNTFPEKEEDTIFMQNLAPLFALLSNDEMDILLQKKYEGYSFNILIDVFPKRVWSSYTSAHFLKLCVAEVRRNYYSAAVKEKLGNMLRFFSPDALQNFNRTIDKMTFANHHEQQKVIDMVHQPLEVFFGHREAIDRM